jgi:hypothetical protein
MCQWVGTPSEISNELVVLIALRLDSDLRQIAQQDILTLHLGKFSLVNVSNAEFLTGTSHHVS